MSSTNLPAPTGDITFWELSLVESPAKISKCEAACLKFTKFLGFYTDLTTANGECLRLRKEEEDLDTSLERKFLKISLEDTPGDAPLSWSSNLDINGMKISNKFCGVRKKCFSPRKTNDFYVEMMKRETEYPALRIYIEPESRDISVFILGKPRIPNEITATSCLDPHSVNFPVRAWEIRVRTVPCRCNGTCYGIYLIPEDAHRKSLEIYEMGRKVCEVMACAGTQGGRLSWTLRGTPGENHSVRYLLGTVEETIILDAAGMENVIDSNIDRTKEDQILPVVCPVSCRCDDLS